MQHNWAQGEHIIMFGGTGHGKTYLGSELLPIRGWSMAISIKRRDDTIDRFTALGYRVIKSIDQIKPSDRRLILHAYPEHLGDNYEPALRVYKALDYVYQMGGWAVFLDDMNELSYRYKLGDHIRDMLDTVRSNGTSLVVGVPRATRHPVEARTQARYVLSFSYDNYNEVNNIADVMGTNHGLVQALMPKLGVRDFIVRERLKPGLMIVRQT